LKQEGVLLAASDYGLSVATAGDVDGDGYADILIGAKTFTNTNAQEGRVYLYLGSSLRLATGPSFPPPDWTMDGGSAGAAFGTSVATAGDVNGDGYSDVLVGAPNFQTSFANEGKAFLYLGSASGLVSSAAWTAESDQAGAQFGVSVATAGDVNGDGYSDVIVGANFYDNGLPDQGRAMVYLGSSSGLGSTPAWAADGDLAGSEFGSSVSTAGDVNGDGYSDVIVGAPDYSGTGRAFVYLGSATGLSTTNSWNPVISGPPNNGFGWSVATAGDVNGDGYSDIIVSAPGYTDGLGTTGQAYLYLGSASGLALAPASTVKGLGGMLLGAVASAGDVNGDGFSDVIVGSQHITIPDPIPQWVDVYLGSPSGLTPSPAWEAVGDQVDAWFGYSVASAGDVNGDGFSDVIVGAPRYDNGQQDEGRAYVYLGSSSGLASSPAWTAETNIIGDEVGWSVASAGDVNGDGFSDVIVGAPHNGNGTFKGRVDVYLGSSSGLASSPAWSAGGDQVDDRFGWSIAPAGDINGDGYSDVIFGAFKYDNGQQDEGRAFLYYGGGSGGAALGRIPRQARSDDTAPIALFGKSDSETSFRVREQGITPAGRGKVRLQWEVKPLGTPFNGSGLGVGTIQDTGAPGGSGSTTSFSELVSGLAEGTFYHWRVRIASPDPLFPYSPWMSLAGNNVTETKLRTAGCVDRDGDGYGALVDPSCPNAAQDCSDSTAGIWDTPGETLSLGFTNGTTLNWSPPTSGALPAALVYDTLRSAVRNDFLSPSTVCVESDDGPNTTTVDAAVPSIGQVFYYLVRAQDACPNGQGSLGTSSSGVPRQGRTCP